MKERNLSPKSKEIWYLQIYMHKIYSRNVAVHTMTQGKDSENKRSLVGLLVVLGLMAL